MPKRTTELNVRVERLRLLPVADPRHRHLADRQLGACRSLIEAARKADS